MNKTLEYRRLDELCDFGSGLWKGKKPPYMKADVIRNTNFTKNCELNDSDIVKLDVEISQFEKRKLKFGDLIIEKSGGGPKQPVGRVILFNIKSGNYSLSNFTSFLRINDKQILDPEYLHKFLYFIYVSGVTESMQSHSTGIRNLNLNQYKRIQVPIPSFSEQKQIVSILNEAFEGIEKAKLNIQQNIDNTKECFGSAYKHIFFNKEKNWKKSNFDIVCKDILAGGDAPKDNFSKIKTVKYGVPIFANAEKNKGLYGFTNIKKVSEHSITVAARGSTIGYTEIRREPFFPIVRLIVLIPKMEIIDLIFLYYITCGVGFVNSGSAIPQLTIPMIKKYEFLLPPLSEQKKIVAKLDTISTKIKNLELIYTKKIESLDELKKSILQKVFSGELTRRAS